MLFSKEQLHISQIRSIVYYAPKGLHFTYPGKLPTYELMLYRKGHSLLTFHGKSFHMAPGSILYLPKGLDNNEYIVDATEEFGLYNIYFDTADPMPAEPMLIASDMQSLCALMEKLHLIWFSKKSGYYYRSLQLIYQLFEALHQKQIRYQTPHKFIPLEPSLNYMMEHYCDIDFDQKQMISLSGLSYSYFKQLFIARYGMPPVKYLTQLRIRRALELLQTKKFSITEIAELCGFENVYYFSNVFKKQTGVCPSGYPAHSGDYFVESAVKKI